MQSNNQKLIVAGAAASVLLAAGYFLATRSKKTQPHKSTTEVNKTTNFTDAEKGTLHYLTK